MVGSGRSAAARIMGTAPVSATTRAEEQDHHHQDLRGAGYHSEDFSW